MRRLNAELAEHAEKSLTDLQTCRYTSAHHVRVQLRLTNSKPARRITCSTAEAEWTNVRNGFPRICRAMFCAPTQARTYQTSRGYESAKQRAAWRADSSSKDSYSA